MRCNRDGLVPIGKVFSSLDAGSLKAFREASAQALHGGISPSNNPFSLIYERVNLYCIPATSAGCTFQPRPIEIIHEREPPPSGGQPIQKVKPPSIQRNTGGKIDPWYAQTLPPGFEDVCEVSDQNGLKPGDPNRSIEIKCRMG